MHALRPWLLGCAAAIAASGCGADGERDARVTQTTPAPAKTPPTTSAPARPRSTIDPVDPRPPLPPRSDPAVGGVLGTAPVALRQTGEAPAGLPTDVDLGALVPEGTRVRRVWRARSRSRFQDGVMVVEWVPAGTPTTELTEPLRWGLSFAAQRPRRTYEYAGRWRAYAIPVLAHPPTEQSVAVSFADITSDGRPDAIVHQEPGTNHGCGPFQAFAGTRAGAIRVYSANACETEVTGRDGLLRIGTADYRKGDSMCCPSFQRTIVRRWTGERYTTLSDRRR